MYSYNEVLVFFMKRLSFVPSPDFDKIIINLENVKNIFNLIWFSIKTKCFDNEEHNEFITSCLVCYKFLRKYDETKHDTNDKKIDLWGEIEETINIYDIRLLKISSYRLSSEQIKNCYNLFINGIRPHKLNNIYNKIFNEKELITDSDDELFEELLKTFWKYCLVDGVTSYTSQFNYMLDGQKFKKKSKYNMVLYRILYIYLVFKPKTSDDLTIKFGYGQSTRDKIFKFIECVDESLNKINLDLYPNIQHGLNNYEFIKECLNIYKLKYDIKLHKYLSKYYFNNLYVLLYQKFEQKELNTAVGLENYIILRVIDYKFDNVERKNYICNLLLEL